ncbi:hypothetical protein [Aminobacter ciceronei]|uniref:SGNH/GDSL hydrolase family protein n=1 Tax=Aminobacter ciceronei TaxID=150723 RepID=A0ABR6C4B4_9HYPH|nr:hypothetical protein [Aminobacter ciceronei]MBA8906061.1 hypothetical protein [Aminobacter ciceronei]MBA9019840.1 hypothetical protein [Aminobacter ciceronei]
MAAYDEERGKIIASGIEVVPDPDRAFILIIRRKKNVSKEHQDASDQAIFERAFSDKPDRSYSTKKRILAEGDSWVNILTNIPGQPDTFVDVIARKYYVNNIGWPGDTFRETFGAKQYKQPLSAGTFDFFVFSGGGVDFFGGDAMKNFVRPYGEGGGSKNAQTYVKDEFDYFLRGVVRDYRTILRETVKWSAPKSTKLVMHGYDYSIPKPNGQYLGRRFEELGFDTATLLPREIVKILVNRFYDALLKVARGSEGRALVVDFRNTIGRLWHDEIHPDNNGAKKLAAEAAKAMKLVL